jgi:exopolysaccharide biosynthesis WecB/TagA/CpsF family protein
MQYCNLFGVRYAATNYEEATSLIIQKAMAEKPGYFGVTALAVHGLMEAYNNKELQEKINQISLIVPDGQPVRWALNYFYEAGLTDRVYGPTLTLHVLAAAEAKGLPVFFYGSKQSTLDKLTANLLIKYPALKIAGVQADRFRDSTEEEKKADRETIIASGAKLVFVGRGCPRQERWVAENINYLPAVLLAVGAAFDFHAGTVSQAPAWMQRRGLEWLYRLIQEPRRLWKRYLVTNTQFCWLFLKKLLGAGV